MTYRLLLFFMGFSSIFANARDKNFPNVNTLQDNQQEKLRDDKENKNSLTLSFINGVTSGALINRFFRQEYGMTGKYTTIINPEIALAEAVCATASAIVDAKPSTANFTGDPIGNSTTQAFYLAAIATNGVNAVYRLWYVKKNVDSGKK